MRRPLRRVVVTGLSTIAPHGFDAEEVFQRLYRGESAIRRITHFDTTVAPCKIGGVVEGLHVSRPVAVESGEVRELLRRDSGCCTLRVGGRGKVWG